MTDGTALYGGVIRTLCSGYLERTPTISWMVVLCLILMRLKIKNIYLLHQSKEKFYEILKNLLDYEDDNNLAHKQADSWSENKCNW